MGGLEPSVPWDRAEFRDGLAALRDGAVVSAQRYALEARSLAALAAMVPRCARDETGATPWTSFLQEVAVAQRSTGRAAAGAVRAAVRLTTCLPSTLATLESGAATVGQAEALMRSLEPYDDDLATRLDAELAARAAVLPAWRIQQEVRRAVQVLDPEAGAQRVALKNAARGVSLTSDADDQACVSIWGPAVPLTRWHARLEQQARALKQAGDPRGLDALRFDLATSAFPCRVHVPSDPDTTAAQPRPGEPEATGQPAATPAGLRPSFVEAAGSDCRMSRPVQALVVVPVETALGLSNEPAWLDGYGWLSAPTTRQLLVDAELRRVCAQSATGRLVDVADRAVRPPPTPAGVRAGLLDVVLSPTTLTGAADRVEPDHDPSEPLRRFVVLRDRACDGPTGPQVPAGRCHLDHDEPHPHGPTAAWNLVARSARTHQLKHYGWIPLRTASSTIWTSPAGQLVEVPHHVEPPPGIDPDDVEQPVLPDPDELDLVDRAQLEPPGDDGPPWLPAAERDTTPWTWLEGDDDVAC